MLRDTVLPAIGENQMDKIKMQWTLGLSRALDMSVDLDCAEPISMAMY